MSAACELSNTGQVVWPVIVVGLVLLVAGVVALVVLGRRRRRSRGGGALVLLLVLAGALGAGAGVVGAAGGPASTAVAAAGASAGGASTTAIAGGAASGAARSASDACPGDDGGASGGGVSGAENTLTIVQTSVNSGMAPEVAPTTLVATITNHGSASAYITRVTVSISSVAKAAGAPAGSCDASDYVLLNTAMAVGRTLGPGQSASFSGASVGFSNKSTNQDACKGATVSLRYVSF